MTDKILFVMFLKNYPANLKIHLLIIVSCWHAPIFAHGGSGNADGLIELAYYLLLVIVSLPLGVAIALRKRRAFFDWLMLALIAPTILFSVRHFSFHLSHFIWRLRRMFVLA